MRLNVVMAVIYVMGRLGIWAPYLRFVQNFLNMLDKACEEEFGIPWQETLDDLEAEPLNRSSS